MWRLTAGRARWLYYATPMAICLAVYWLGLKTWFRNDDFAWLGLRLQVHSFHDLMWALFTPLAQGTVRTLSDRTYFMAFSSLLGVHALPMRLFAFLTQFANLALLSVITRRITHSPVAGFLAPIFWCINSALALTMTWSSAYNQLLCGFFILAAFYLLLRHIDDGSRKSLAGMWLCYLLGFGALEHIVVFPALATFYCLCFARPYLRKTLPLFVPAIAFVIGHYFLIDHVDEGRYRLYFDLSLFSTFATYWAMATAAFRVNEPLNNAYGVGLVLTSVLTLALVGFAAWRLRRRDWRGIFFLGWYALLLAPVLPLKNHIDPYYLTLPLTGLAMLGAWACAESLKWKPAAFLAASVAALYLFVSWRDLRPQLRWYYNNAHAMKVLMIDLSKARAAHPDKIILLDGVTDELYWSGFDDHPFRLLGIDRIYLTPGAERSIHTVTANDALPEYTFPARAAMNALQQKKAVVYRVAETGKVAEETGKYELALQSQHPENSRGWVDVGDVSYSSQLGPEWYGIYDRSRWMPKTATLTMHGPLAASDYLAVSGFFPEGAASAGPFRIRISADSFDLGEHTAGKAGERFDLNYPLPSELVGRPSVHIQVRLDHTVRVPPDIRDLGLVFYRFEIKPAEGI